MRRVIAWLTLLLIVGGCGSAAVPAPLAGSPEQVPGAQTAAGTGASTAKPLDKASLRLDFILAGYHAPFFLALQQGYYRDAGIDLAINPGQGSVTTAQVVANGSDTFGFVDGGAMMPLVAKGLQVKMVMDLFQRNGTSIISLTKTGIHTPQDLVDKRIAFYPGGSGPVLLKAFLSAVHLQGSQLNMVSANPQNGHAVVLDGQADGLLGYGYVDAPQFESKGAPVSTLDFADYGIEVPEHGIIASNKTIAQDPDLVRRFVQATAKGFTAAQQDPQGAMDALLAANPGAPLDRQAALQEEKLSFGLLHTPNSQGHPLGWMAAADWQAGQKLLAEGGVIAQPESDVNAYFTNAFVQGG